MRALVFDRFGGPDVLDWREIPDPEPRAGHAIVRLRAIGLNFADVYRRRGSYHLVGSPPYVAGYEGAGVVEVTPDGGSFRVGDRVAFADSPHANAERVLVPHDRLVPLPEAVPFDVAAAILLQGWTAQYLVRDSHLVQPGEEVLVHAAGGGVGLLLVQMARRSGARVLALASSEDKRQAALEAGADGAMDASGPWVAAVAAWSRHGGVDVVYDSVGTTLGQSFAATRIGGCVVFYGMAGGDPPPVDPRVLMDRSLTLTGGDLWNVLRTPDERRARAAELFLDVARGTLVPRIARRFPLAEGARAHAFLESRAAIGKVLLIPDL
jgi:NADPH2:quinone reductase